ncbi:MAG: hypothetical protein EU529_15530 [Promethearchaeota archaeon]|nr:MAG: hypothetical protein EU529_15530 [Candidatus Lokiarchaeota archaeon]
MSAPNVVKVIQKEGAISDEIDYAIMSYLMKKRGGGFTACQPSLVELEGGKQAIKMGIDSTFIGKNNQLMGLGIVGLMFIDLETLNVIYCTPLEELEANIKKLEESGIEPQHRPKGKY